MRERDRFEAERAEEARRWLMAPERKAEESADMERRAERDRAAGHLPTCGLMQCRPECPARSRA